MEIIKEMLDLVVCCEEMYSSIDDIHPHVSESFKECFSQFQTNVSLNNSLTLADNSIEIKLDYVFSYLHDHLNIGKWSEVPQNKRKAFTSVCFLKSCFSVKDASVSNLRIAISYLDKGFLLGLASPKNTTVLTDCAKVLSECIQKQNKDNLSEFKSEIDLITKSCKRKRSDYESYWSLNGTEIDAFEKPSIEEFSKKYFVTMIPVRIKDCMAHWPALTKWIDIKYILEKAGERIVPIELGSYSADNFSQKLMTVKDYIKSYYFGEKDEKVGYLAQHDLLTQIPELKEDICIPEYCCISRNSGSEVDSDLEPEICAWFGPKNTVSALHYDPKDNLLCQVYGTKQVILFSPSDSKYLYPHPEFLLTNTAQVNPALPDLVEYPNFPKARMYKCLLEAGDMLYIPPKWWHHVTALEKSFSINFWWL